MPKGKIIKTEFGEYTSTITQLENTVTYTREITINRGEWPKEKYDDFVDLYSGIVGFDKAKLVLKLIQ